MRKIVSDKRCAAQRSAQLSAPRNQLHLWTMGDRTYHAVPWHVRRGLLDGKRGAGGHQWPPGTYA